MDAGRPRTWPARPTSSITIPCACRAGRPGSPTHALAQVLVRGADHHLARTPRRRPRCGRRRQGVVGFELDHGHTVTPIASRASSSRPNWPSSSGSTPAGSCTRATCGCGTTRSRGPSPPPRGSSRRDRPARAPTLSTPRTAATAARALRCEGTPKKSPEQLDRFRRRDGNLDGAKVAAPSASQAAPSCARLAAAA